jgi:large subunit ribosomal protein L18
MSKTKQEKLLFRKQRVRKKIFGTSIRPRLSVYRSLKHIYAQIIDDSKGVTLVSASSLSPEIRKDLKNVTKTECAKIVGKLLAKRAIEKNIKEVVFDRNGRLYHGRIKALAESARESGLKF